MNATKAGRPQKNRLRIGPGTISRFFERSGQLYVETTAAKQTAHVKSTAALKVTFAAAYASYKATGGAL